MGVGIGKVVWLELRRIEDNIKSTLLLLWRDDHHFAGDGVHDNNWLLDRPLDRLGRATFRFL